MKLKFPNEYSEKRMIQNNDDSLNSIEREAFQFVKSISKLDLNDAKTEGSCV